MSKVPRLILVLVTGSLVWGSTQQALAQPSGPPPASAGPAASTPVLGLAPLAGQPVMPPTEWAAPAAGEPCLEEPVYHEFCFPKKSGTLEFMTGSYYRASVGPPVPSLDWIPFNIRIGHVYDWPCCEGALRGCFEPMIEFTAARIYNGFGSVLVGPTAFLRYNFVQPDRRFVPYWQVGIGFVYTDAYRDQTQNAISQPIELYLQTQIGVKWFLRNNVSFNVEAGYINISAGNANGRNFGISAFGGTVGMTYYFPLCWK